MMLRDKLAQHHTQFSCPARSIILKRHFHMTRLSLLCQCFRQPKAVRHAGQLIWFLSWQHSFAIIVESKVVYHPQEVNFLRHSICGATPLLSAYIS